MSLAKFFAGRLRELRSKAGVTQKELAERAGLSELGVRQLEIGRREPSFETVLKIAQGLGVSLSAFDPPPEEPPKRNRRKAKDD